MIIDFTLLLVVQGAALLGIISGIVGSFALLRQQSLLGDALSHAALPGIVLMFLLTHSKNPWILVMGGSIAGIIGIVASQYILTHTTLKKDAVLGIILSVFFGFGLVLITVVQKYGFTGQAVLNKFLFGTVSTLLPVDIFIFKIITVIVATIVILFWKELLLYTFDATYCRMLGFSVNRLELLLTALLILAIIIGLQTVGVVLMSTLLIAPAAAARQWSQRFNMMIMLSALFGSVSAIVGVLLSSCIDHVPTGPAIVVTASSIVFVSLLCAPRRNI